MSSEKMLRVAVIGSGRVGRARVREVNLRQDAKVVAVASRSMSRAQELAASCGAEASDDWQATAARPDIDAVMICSLNAFHAPMVEFALRAGKHASVDYPLALSLADADRLLALAVDARRILHVEHIELLSPWFVACEGNLHRIGKVQEISWTNISARQFSADDWTFDRAAGFSLFAQASLLSRIIWCVGMPEWIEAQETLDGDESGCYRRRETQATFGFAGGVGRIFDAVGMGTAGPSGELIIAGESGRLVAQNLKEVTFTALGGNAESLALPPSGGLFARDIASFVNEILRGEESYAPLAHIRNVVRCADAAESSIEKGKRIML